MSTGSGYGPIGHAYPIAVPQRKDGRMASLLILEHSIPVNQVATNLADQISTTITTCLAESLHVGILKRLVISLFDELKDKINPNDQQVILKKIETLIKNSSPKDKEVQLDPKFYKWLIDTIGPEIDDSTSAIAWQALRVRREDIKEK